MALDYLAILKDLGVESNPWQDQIVEDPRRHIMMRAARRTGKSKTGAKRALRKIIPDPNAVKSTATRTWIVGPSYDLAHKEFRYIREFVEGFCRMTGQPAPHVRESPSSGDLYLRAPWDAEVLGKSAQKPEQLVGEECDLILMSEPAMHKAETWERYCRPCLTTRKGESIWPFTPDSGGLWLYELELGAQGRPDWGLYTMPAWDCPHYDPDEIESARRDLSEDAFYEQYGGEWRFYTGRVYRNVQQDTHFVEPFDIPGGWKIRTATDFGLRDATCTLWMAQAPTGEGYFIDEYYYTGQDRSTQDHAAAMLKRESDRQYRPLVRIADHHGLGAQLILDASRAGWKAVPCQSQDRRARRDRMLTALAAKPRPAPYHVREGLGKAKDSGAYPDLFFFKGRCPNLQRELQFLRWKDTARREGSMGDTEGDDHAIDAAEYVTEYSNIGATARYARNKRAGQSNFRPAGSSLTGYY